MTDIVHAIHTELKRQAKTQTGGYISSIVDDYISFEGKIDLRLLAGTAQNAVHDSLLEKIKGLLR